MVGTAVLFHRHLYLHQIDSHSSWPKVIYVAFQVGLAPFLTLNIGQLTKDKIGHKAWEVLLPATLNITFFWLVFEIYVRSLPVGTTSDARVRTSAFFLVLLSGGLFWIQTFFSYFHRQRNPIPAFPLTIEIVVFGLITGLVMGFAAPERLAAFRW
jgi:hypothetical protein